MGTLLACGGRDAAGRPPRGDVLGKVTIELTPAAVDWIAEHGHQPEFGARPMRRTIQREVENRLSRLLLDGEIMPGQQVTIDVGDGRLTFTAHDRAGAPAAAS